MDAGLFVQYAVVALVVLLSAGFVVRRQFPRALRGLRVALAVRLLREGRPAWVRRIGRALAPSAVVAGNDCGGCDGCH